MTAALWLALTFVYTALSLGLLFSAGLFFAWLCLAGFCASVIFGALFYVTVLEPPTSLFGVACVLLVLFIFLSRLPLYLQLSALLALASAPDIAADSIPASLLGVLYLLLILIILLSRRPVKHKVLALVILGLVSGIADVYLQRSRVTNFPHSRPSKAIRYRSLRSIYWSEPVSWNIFTWSSSPESTTYSYSFSDLFDDLLSPFIFWRNTINVRAFGW